ncbi:MAG: hypothetical protein F6K48_20250 [Okeania sp. SIO3H1]|uniref:hypothetical protein n=1 Tax=Okeania sp. SIO1I7 TaxID=2607772 RepID=UPI0013CB496C|nr:hypothetical protein [Okeania sp. SIO1I7]NEN91107.1 hypothetical protein [Okeania sp. SIO3H1]
MSEGRSQENRIQNLELRIYQNLEELDIIKNLEFSAECFAKRIQNLEELGGRNIP